MYKYNAKVTQVYDGDTITVEIDLGFKIVFELKLRLARINTPEIRGKEKVEGKIVRDIVREMILDKMVVIHTDKKGKFGRYIAEVFVKDHRMTLFNLNDWLVANNHAEKYK